MSSRYADVVAGEVVNVLLWDGTAPAPPARGALVPWDQAAHLPAALLDRYTGLSDDELRRVLAERVRARASGIIQGAAPITAQINRLARGLDLVLQQAEGTPLTDLERAELQTGRDLYRLFVIPVRTKSNELEATLAGMTRAQLLAADAAGWPDLWTLA